MIQTGSIQLRFFFFVFFALVAARNNSRVRLKINLLQGKNRQENRAGTIPFGNLKGSTCQFFNSKCLGPTIAFGLDGPACTIRTTHRPYDLHSLRTFTSGNFRFSLFSLNQHELRRKSLSRANLSTPPFPLGSLPFHVFRSYWCMASNIPLSIGLPM